jgi:hypothetical protein
MKRCGAKLKWGRSPRGQLVSRPCTQPRQISLTGMAEERRTFNFPGHLKPHEVSRHSMPTVGHVRVAPAIESHWHGSTSKRIGMFIHFDLQRGAQCDDCGERGTIMHLWTRRSDRSLSLYNACSRALARALGHALRKLSPRRLNSGQAHQGVEADKD